eukprot:jgi/Botrbrau1/20231/Bobra.31_1s0027.1
MDANIMNPRRPQNLPQSLEDLEQPLIGWASDSMGLPVETHGASDKNHSNVWKQTSSWNGRTSSKSFRRDQTTMETSMEHLLENNEDLAFTIVVKREGLDEGTSLPDDATGVVQEAVNDVVRGAVQGAVQEVVQDAVQQALEQTQEAVQIAISATAKFDVRANFFTLVAISGVVFYWRGLWTLWDYSFGTGQTSALICIGCGLGIMTIFPPLQLSLA